MSIQRAMSHGVCKFYRCMYFLKKKVKNILTPLSHRNIYSKYELDQPLQHDVLYLLLAKNI